MTPEEVNVYCLQGMHLRDPSTGMCLECGDVKDPVAEHAELAANEPPRGSAVMADGPTGTVWQRFNGDGLWHSTTGKRAPWHTLIKSDRPGARMRTIYLPPRVR